MSMSFWSLLAAGAALCFVVMLLLWWLGLRTHNFSYVDIGWCANFALLAILYGIYGTGDPGRRLLICAMYGIWSTRLAIHLTRRIVGEPEEGRYVQLRKDWGASGNVDVRFLAFFQFQALLNIVLSIPMLIAVMDPAPVQHMSAVAGVVIWVAAVLGESIADAQLARFKRQPANKGKVCDVGLWGVSRHPNYFCEWMIWIAYATFAFNSPHGWVALAMPALMLHFLINVTGVKATEVQALSSRGDAYRRYQARVSAFVPWFPKKTASDADSRGDT